MCADDEEREVLQEIVNNVKLSEGYLELAHDIEVMEPKTPDDIYKVYTSTQHLSFSCWIGIYSVHLLDISLFEVIDLRLSWRHMLLSLYICLCSAREVSHDIVALFCQHPFMVIDCR